MNLATKQSAWSRSSSECGRALPRELRGWPSLSLVGANQLGRGQFRRLGNGVVGELRTSLGVFNCFLPCGFGYVR